MTILDKYHRVVSICVEGLRRGSSTATIVPQGPEVFPSYFAVERYLFSLDCEPVSRANNQTWFFENHGADRDVFGSKHSKPLAWC